MNSFQGIAFLTVACFAWGCSKADVATPSQDNLYALLTAANTEIDLGLFASRVQREARFDIQNPSDKTVRILATKGSCSCTSVTSTSSEIQPHGNAVILAVIAPRDGAGDFRITVQVDYATDRGPEKPGNARRLNLTVRGATFDPRKLRINPAAIEIGDKPPGSHIESRVTLSQGDGSAVSSEMFEAITPSWMSSDLSQAGNEAVLKITGTVPMTSGPFFDSIQVNSKSDQFENTRIPVSGYVVGDISVKPRSIVPVVQSAGPTTVDAQVSHTLQRHISISKISTEGATGGSVSTDQSMCIDGVVVLQLRPAFEKDSLAVRGRVIVEADSDGGSHLLTLPFLFIRRRE